MTVTPTAIRPQPSSNGKTLPRDFTHLSAVELAGLIARGEASSVEVVEAHIRRIEEVNPKLNAVVVKRYEPARAKAQQADAKRQRGETLGPLHGVPLTIKECLDLHGTPSTFGLSSRASHRAEQDDGYVARLRAAGAIPLGKTNVAQLLLYYESDNPVYGRTNNPWNVERTSGGSSGGEAAIIAAGGSPLGLGTDIGGSLRVPATFCGIASIKPTTGRANDPGRYSVPLGQRAIVSQVGVMARRVSDVALGLEVINGANVQPPLPLGNFREVDISKLRVAFHTHDGTLTVAPTVRRAVKEAAEMLKAAGAQVFEWTPPDVPLAFRLFFELAAADGGQGFARMWGRDKRDPRAATLALLGGLSRPAAGAISGLLKLLGQPTLGNFVGQFGHHDVDHYWQAVEAQMDYQTRFAGALQRESIDVILAPACALPAFTHGAASDLGVAGG
ncbi:MAG TPA: amidase family protein, partial [Anaerolineales bacterium]|nr:amidase family protein [Anaerolineales bacterium]